MKLLTKDILEKLPPLYTTENEADPMVWVKFFSPDSSGWIWLATEFSPEEGTFFGYVISGMDPAFSELGYFSLTELEQARGPMGLPIERDMYFTPKPLSQAKAEETGALGREGGRRDVETSRPESSPRIQLGPRPVPDEVLETLSIEEGGPAPKLERGAKNAMNRELNALGDHFEDLDEAIDAIYEIVARNGGNAAGLEGIYTGRAGEDHVQIAANGWGWLHVMWYQLEDGRMEVVKYVG